MTIHAHNSSAERAGLWLGRAWRGWVRQETRAVHWMVDNGASPTVARSLLWVVKLIAIAALLYVAVWLALVVLVAVVTATVMRRADPPSDHWFPKPADHRDELFYHPLTYNDDPDPRFEDD